MLQIFAIIDNTSVMNFGKKLQHDFPKMRGGDQRPFGTFPKIHPFWRCEASLSLLTEYKFALSLGHTNTEFHIWTKKVLRKQDKWLKATLKIFTLIAGSPKRVDCRLRKKRAPTLNACQYSLLQTSAERNMRDCAEAPLPCSATLLIQSKEVWYNIPCRNGGLGLGPDWQCDTGAIQCAIQWPMMQ